MMQITAELLPNAHVAYDNEKSQEIQIGTICHLNPQFVKQLMPDTHQLALNSLNTKNH